MPLDIFSSYYLAGMVKGFVPKGTFFRDRYFPTSAGDIFRADKVLVEYKDGDRKMAPFVVQRVGDIPIARGGYEIHEYEPPYIAPSRVLTLDNLNKRGFGEAILSNKSAEERAKALIAEDLTDLDLRITRREEWMAVQTIINNGVTMTAYIDDKTIGETYDVFYYDTAGSNPALYTVADKWDDAGGDWWADVEAMCIELSARGISCSDLIVGSAVAQFIQDDEKVAKRLDNRGMSYGSVAPRIAYPGVAFIGALVFGGFRLDIYSVHESYEDDTGAVKRIFPADSALVIAPDCGHMMYAQVVQMERDEQYHTFAERRIPKLMTDTNIDSRKFRLAARPLAAPKVKAPWMYAPNVLK